MKQYDLIVLGSGGAGYRVAMRCAKAGWKVALIEENKVWGGTCDNRGCIPKKILYGAAEVADLNQRFHKIGIVTQPAELDWPTLIKFKNSFTSPVSNETKKPLKQAGVDLFQGSPKFIDPHTIEVGKRQLTAKYFHIAVGAKPFDLSIEGAEHLTTSDTFLGLEHLPKRIIFVGGGFISFELAHVAARFGAMCKIIHQYNQPLAQFDPDCVKTLVDASSDCGIEVITGTAVKRIQKQKALIVHTDEGQSYEADIVVHGAGRAPAIQHLNLEAANVKYSRSGIKVNDYLQSVSNPNIYAGGDAVAGSPPLSPVARLHGAIVAENLLGKKVKQPSYRSTPSVVFAYPPLAMVGLTQQAAKEQGIKVQIHSEDMSGWFDAKRTNLKFAKYKILVDEQTDKIVGAHIIGNHAEDIINVFSLAIDAGLTTKQLQNPIYAFPSPSDDIRYML